MPAYSGKFQYTGENGAILNQGPCQVTFDAETCVVTPAGGTPLAFDLGDVDRTVPAEWDLQLVLYTGRIVTLKQFGAAFSDMARELLAAWRDRTVRCLLLEDLEEAGRYQGMANGGPAEIRIFKSNIAILPQAATPIQWRLAEVDTIRFDDAAYNIILTRGDERLVLSKLAKKTDEVFGKLTGVLTALREHAATVLHGVFPFLNADQLARLLQIMPEGRSAGQLSLDAIHPKLSQALVARAVDERLKPYFDDLRSRAVSEPLMAGFKFIRPNEEEEASEGESETETEAPAEPLFFWFWVPLPGNLAAWESTSGSGRATYFFRTEPPFAGSVAGLTRGLALVNFRREPVYLSDDSLDQQQRYHRYAIGARKLPELRRLRSAYVGRAIHSSFETWQEQVTNVINGR
ncbi:MAG TPA: hypothetical protein VMS37_22780 [Verrucomicrobiae bacterium]|nr:hypothetical protein [Verrucomicrobiae bacterium]